LELAETRDAHAVDEDHRKATTAAAAAAGSRGQRLDQVGDRTRTVGGDVGFVELEYGRRGRIDGAAQGIGGDDDRTAVGRIFLVILRRRGDWPRCRRVLRSRRQRDALKRDSDRQKAGGRTLAQFRLPRTISTRPPMAGHWLPPDEQTSRDP